jgi:hypothetical protein
MGSKKHFVSTHKQEVCLMTKTKLVNALEQGAVIGNSNQPQNLADLGYRHGGVLQSVKQLATWALDHVKGFPDDVSDEDILSIRQGYKRKHSELNPAIQYCIIEGKYLKVSDMQLQGIEMPKNAEVVNIGVDYAFSFTQQQAGKIKETHNPVLHGIVALIRTDCNKYETTTYKKLVAEGNKILKERKGEKTERKGNLAFMEYLYNDKGVFDTMKTRCKNAKAKGDEFADVAKLDKAIQAFKAIYKK